MRWVDLAYVILRREIPGQWSALRGHLEQAPEPVQREFHNVIRALEAEIDNQKRQVRQPWRRA